MITTYIEIHQDRDNSRNLIPIESIGGVAEVSCDVEIIEFGVKHYKKVTKTQILVNNVPYFVKETYDEIKTQVNKICTALRTPHPLN